MQDSDFRSMNDTIVAMYNYGVRPPSDVNDGNHTNLTPTFDDPEPGGDESQ